ncbi:MAG: family 10 glycosylhydrolase [Gemmatimonadaceae bacterium]
MRVTVIGATGHIGSWLVPRLVRAGHDVVAVSRGVRRPYHESPEWESVRMVEIDRVAAEADRSFGLAIARLESDTVVDLTCFDVESAEHVVGALRDNVDLFLHCGTLWVHGIPKIRPYDETFPRRPFGEYGIKKAKIETYLMEAATEGFPASVLHPGHITGPGWAPINPAGNLDMKVFERLGRGEIVTLPDEGSATLQHVHADDVAQAFELAIAKPESAIGESFHVAAREPVTFREYAEAVASWSNREAMLEFQPWKEWRKTVSERDAQLTEDHMLHSPCASVAKAETRLGFKPKFSALEAVRDALGGGAFRILALFICMMNLAACAGSTGDVVGPTPIVTDTVAPPVMREMRGMWIATVANIDWPSSRTLTSTQQQNELIDILNKAKAAGLNTIVLQVRPAGDAVYLSSLEPWAKLLTGTQGGNPGYDPLAFAILEAHSRGMELHAWINPFRAGNTSDTATMVAPHLFKTRRDLIRVYGSDILMDPGEPDVQDWSIAVIKDIVARYDIDGLHADDYFYPYVINDNAGKPVPFPDSATFAKYGNGVALADWRRANIDKFVERMYREAHNIKPFIKVGISPFGIWRPGNPTGISGLDAYASIYTDSRKWLQQGWVDYLAPQLYWAIAPPQQSYTALLDWWLGQNTMGRNVWPGLATYRVQDGKSSAFSLTEIPDQIRATRQRTGGTGNLFYNTTWTLSKNNLAATLAGDLFKIPALVPASPWLDAVSPDKPTISVVAGVLTITRANSEPARWWTLRSHAASGWTTRILFGTDRIVSLSGGSDRVLVQAVDQAGNASSAAEWRK